jgi:hypothetical protein
LAQRCELGQLALQPSQNIQAAVGLQADFSGAGEEFDSIVGPAGAEISGLLHLLAHTSRKKVSRII